MPAPSASIPVVFEVLDYQQMNEVAAYGGFAAVTTTGAWARQYNDELSKSYRFGLSKIYANNLVRPRSLLCLSPSLQQSDRRETRVMSHVSPTATFSRTTSTSPIRTGR